MKKQIAVLISVLFVVTFIVWFVLRDKPHAEGSSDVVETQKPVADSQAASGVAPAPVGSSPQTPSAAMNSAPSSPEETEFQRWISEEGQQIDQRGMNSEEKRLELVRTAKQLTPTKASQLVRIARNVSAPAGEKILAAYLLVESGPVAQEQLGSLIASPLEYGSQQEPHSEGEMRAAQERSMRVMAIEGLAARAESDASARETLERTIPTIPDPYIKGYAEKRLAKIRGQ